MRLEHMKRWFCEKLESMGAQEGDQVRILDFYFDYRK